MNRFPALLCCVVLTAAANFAQGVEKTSVAPPMPFPARGGDVDWGVALSGGGLRSAAFSIGAMKAFYDLGLMDDVDVISSVSGGGYASFWLYSRYDGKRRFGAGAFDDTEFPAQVCSLANRSRFFPFRQMLAAIFSPRGVAFRSYRRAIQRSFGTEEAKDRRLDQLNADIDAARAPYFILNTTLKSLEKQNGRKPSAIDKSFEIAPTYRGNRILGYAPWSGDEIPIESMADAVAMSGAAVRFKLSRKIPDFSGTRKLDLADGGFSENLAALPLILRGVKNIVIVDAENDPAYKFVSYCRLRKHLDAANIKFSVKQIDDFIDCTSGKKKTKRKQFTTSVAVGSAVSEPGYDGRPIRSTIYFIKMSRPASIFSESAIKAAGIVLDDLDYDGKTRPNACARGQLEPINRRTMLRDVLAYARHLNGNWRWGKFIAFLPYINYNFPQITTIDQTFYSDQVDAFIGLGYLEGCEMDVVAGLDRSCDKQRAATGY